MKLFITILLIVSATVNGQGKKPLPPRKHSAKEVYDSLMVVKWQKRLDSLHKYENPKYLAIDKKNWAWADSLNRWLIRKSEDEYLNEPKVSIDAARTKKDREARAKK